MTAAHAVLDNPVWHALAGPHARFATGTKLAMRYRPEIAPFAATIDGSEAALDDLVRGIPEGGASAVLATDFAAELPGCETQRAFSVDQMVSELLIGEPVKEHEALDEIVDLGAGDVPEMLKLVELTEPGPFFDRTVEMGRYIGIRRAGRLAAMAGERMHPPGYCEISAVCTHPDYRRNGYAALLVRVIASGIRNRGEIPFLHVVPTNDGAIRVYAALGFRLRRHMQIRVIARKAKAYSQ